MSKPKDFICRCMGVRFNYKWRFGKEWIPKCDYV